MSSLAAYALPEAYPTLAAAISPWLPTQRWFQGKARTVNTVEVVDTAVLHERVLDVFVEVSYTDGHIETYQVPLTSLGPDEEAADVIAVREDLVLVDATGDGHAAGVLADMAMGTRVVQTTAGKELIGRPLTDNPPGFEGAPRRVAGEQSNTSIILGDEGMLKLFRRLEPGVNPDVEVTRALTERGFTNVPAQLGSWELVHEPEPVALAVLSVFIPDARDAWEGAVAAATNPAAAAEHKATPDDYARLGAVVARMHEHLREAFGAQPSGPGEIGAWADAMAQQLKEVSAAAAGQADPAVAAVLDRLGDVEQRFATLHGIGEAGPLLRVHGDLHLGQILVDQPGDWRILDFEGEPARSLADRRAPTTPLRDVAGILRSFDYAAATATRRAAESGEPADDEASGWAATWRDASRTAFWESYRQHAEAAGLLPDTPATVDALVAIFELDKAVYELGYELANRPAWVPIPAGGILRVLADAETGTAVPEGGTG